MHPASCPPTSTYEHKGSKSTLESLLNPVDLHVSHRSQVGASSRDPDALTGENLPEIVRALPKQLRGVTREDVDGIRTGKMEPWNLIRLSRPVTTEKKTHTAADYTDNPLVFICSFLNYTWIYESIFNKQHPDVVLAQNRFTSFITLKAEIFSWKTCLEYAMNRLGSIMTSSIHDAEAWLRHPKELIYAYFMALADTMASTNSKPSTHNISAGVPTPTTRPQLVRCLLPMSASDSTPEKGAGLATAIAAMCALYVRAQGIPEELANEDRIFPTGSLSRPALHHQPPLYLTSPQTNFPWPRGGAHPSMYLGPVLN
ncbi:hypothetical protein E4U60_007442 [Claviceps pazoutovae]|uniref:Uncharacterized protein n=1 Tax=Claviceps pazoutovae TaxID=1649127 RepID=A0A9P7MFK0_9HYPO|nr:hypothetical protein E4U60_007442 [Claviceps pazoutovae]